MSDDESYSPRSGTVSRSKCGRSKFSPEEDKRLTELVSKFKGEQDWIYIASKMPKRSIRQCRERWKNYLDPMLNKGEWAKEDDEMLLQKVREMGPCWNAIGRCFDRSGNCVRNRFLVINRKCMKQNLGHSLFETLPHKDLTEKQKKLHKEKQHSMNNLLTPSLLYDADIEAVFNQSQFDMPMNGIEIPFDLFF